MKIKNIDIRKKEKGSSIILVIMIVITLVMIGVMSIITTMVSYRMSEKSLKWTKTYYTLDSRAQVFLSEFEKLTKESKSGSNIDIKKLAQGLDKIKKDDTEILINDFKLGDSLDKLPKMRENSHVGVEIYLLDNDIKSFYVSLKIPSENKEKIYDITSYKMLPREFDFEDSDVKFSDQAGEEIQL